MEYAVVGVVALAASGLTFFSGFGLGTLLLPALAVFVPVEQAVALGDGPTIDADAFDRLPRGAGSGGGSLRGDLRDIERIRITEALDRHAGNQTQAAKALGMSRRTFLNRLDDYGLPRPRRRE